MAAVLPSQAQVPKIPVVPQPTGAATFRKLPVVPQPSGSNGANWKTPMLPKNFTGVLKSGIFDN